MSSFASLGIVILSGLTVASLALPLGSLLLLYHSSKGKHIQKKTRRLVSSFVAGVTLVDFLILATLCFLVSILSFYGTLSKLTLTVVFSLLPLFALFVWFFYYRLTNTTELWLPRHVAKFIDSRASLTSNNSEAFSLGVLTALAELPFSLLPFLLSADALLRLDNPSFEALSLVLFVVLAILPLLVLRFAIRSGANVAEIQRWRLRHKTFFRAFSGGCFIALGFFLLAFVILEGVL